MDLPDDDLASLILEAIADLTFAEQADVIHALISVSLRELPSAAIHELRDEIAGQFDAAIPIVGTTLDLIDGHLALRELMGPTQS